MKNWKTTVGGVLMSCGTLLMTSSDSIVHTVGLVCNIAGGLLLGTSAVDAATKNPVK